MTREEREWAIEILQEDSCVDCSCANMSYAKCTYEGHCDIRTAMTMAIETLKAEPCGDFIKYIHALRKCAKEHEGDATPTFNIRISDLCRDTANLLESIKAEPCGDCVSREAVRNMCCEMNCNKERDKCAFRNICKHMNYVSALPSVTHERPKGEWIINDTPDTVRGYWAECTNCHKRIFGGGHICPNCGADMRGEQT